MCVNARIASRPCQVFVLTVRDVLVAPRVAVFLRKTEVNYMHYILPLPQTNLIGLKCTRLNQAHEEN